MCGTAASFIKHSRLWNILIMAWMFLLWHKLMWQDNVLFWVQ